jgi:uncharacterized membrane protein
MTQNLGVWLMAAGAIVLAFGGLRLYSIVFADPTAAADVRTSEGGIWVGAIIVGLVLIAAGWWLRRSRATA